MDDQNDELIQAMLDRQAPMDDPALMHLLKNDVDAYRLLYDLLETPHAEGLSPDFARQVSAHIRQKSDKRFEYLFTAFLGILTAAGVAFACLIISREDIAFFFALLYTYKWVIILALLIIGLAAFVDSRPARARLTLVS